MRRTVNLHAGMVEDDLRIGEIARQFVELFHLPVIKL